MTHDEFTDVGVSEHELRQSVIPATVHGVEVDESESTLARRRCGRCAFASMPDTKVPSSVAMVDAPESREPTGVELRPGMSELKVVSRLVPCFMNVTISAAVGVVVGAVGVEPSAGRYVRPPVLLLASVIVGEVGETMMKSSPPVDAASSSPVEGRLELVMQNP